MKKNILNYENTLVICTESPNKHLNNADVFSGKKCNCPRTPEG